MKTKSSLAKHKQLGFTIIEMMIVVAIIGILAAIAYPAYQNYILSTHRKAAIADILEIQQNMEQSYTINNGAYSSGAIGWVDAAAASCNGGIANNTSGTPTPRYWITVASANQQAYTITATPCPNQNNDTCGTLSINQAGVRQANGNVDGDCF